MIHQLSHTTSYDRYPEVFGACASLIKKPVRILSFGCSNGTEVETLRNLYFKKAEIHGVEVDSEYLAVCKRLEDALTSFSETPWGLYGLIFCMSVLCRWGPVDVTPYMFYEFNTQLVELNEHLITGGFLVIYNSMYRFSDSSVYEQYEAVGEFEDSGFVPKYDLRGNQVFGYKHVIFKKTR